VRILVTGATGYVGSRLITALLAVNHDIVAAARNPDRLKRFGWYDDVTGVALNVSDTASSSTAFAQAGPIEVAYFLVHGIGQPGYRDGDRTAAARFAQAARDAGVKRIVYLGGFVPEGDKLSDHLASRAEVAGALRVDGGAELVWLRAAIIIGAGSAPFEITRYVGDRLWLIPMPTWVENRIDPISVRDVLHYLVAAADARVVPPGGYDICGPETTTYRGLLAAYLRAARARRARVRVRVDNGIQKTIASRVAAAVVPVPSRLAADLVVSLDHPMTASDARLPDRVPEPPGGRTTVDDAIAAALSSRRPRPVHVLADPHHLADTDPVWAGGDALRIRRVTRAVTPPIARPALGLVDVVPRPVAAAVRTGLDMLIDLTPRGRTA
jgi:uncharacterized protein YbjT (DUF2867 family)